MKIEKISDHQIKCTLTKADLADRQLKLSEIAYGSEKAKSLFREMMHQAFMDFGFEADDIPLMIEAVPLGSESLVLIITKVDDPEELDTRFSKFAPSVHASADDIPDEPEGADGILDMFRKIHDSIMKNIQSSQNQNQDGSAAPLEDVSICDEQRDLTLAFVFSSIGDVVNLSHVLKGFYDADNSLYRDGNSYVLILTKGEHTPEDFNRLCNIISEYGKSEHFTSAYDAYLDSHAELILGGNALQQLAAV